VRQPRSSANPSPTPASSTPDPDLHLQAEQASADEPHDKVDKKLRAREFANWLVETYGAEYLNSGEGVLDIAGGKGPSRAPKERNVV
jgi:hypothetical protein